MPRKHKPEKDSFTYQMEKQESMYKKHWTWFIEKRCLRPGAWCGGGEIPKDARNANVRAPVDVTPCPYLISGRCTHENRPQTMRTEQLKEQMLERCKKEGIVLKGAQG